MTIEVISLLKFFGIMNKIDFKQFPTTRYQGSKRKILPWIYECLNEIGFDSVLDACGGSGSVSYLFKKMNKQVTFNDKLKFNSLIGKAIIENSDITFNEEDYRTLLANNDYVQYGDFISKTFKGIYYLPRENNFLDKITANITYMNHYHGHVLEYKKAIAYYALFQSSIIKRPFNLFHRNNLTIRTNEVERNFGNKVTWDKPFEAHLKRFIKEVNNSVINTGRQCASLNYSILDIPTNNYDLVYIDSPYLNRNGKNETSNYLKCYHFLEGLSNYTNWANEIDYESTNLRFKNIGEKNHFSKKEIYKTFELIFEKFRNSILVVSYKKGGFPSIDFIVKLMKQFKKNVTTKSQHYIYALNKQNGNAKTNREVLIIGE